MPLHELMHPAHFPDKIITGAQPEMVGVGKYQAGIQFLKLSGGKCFDRRLGAHRCKDGGGNISVRCVIYPRTGGAITGDEFERKCAHEAIIPGGGVVLPL